MWGMDVFEGVALLAAGLVAGAINAVVGSGTLVTFPTLLAFGYSPVLANVTNNIGVLPGSVSGAWAYRRELAGQRARVARLAGASVLGGLIGAIALLKLPASAFEAIVPALILLACALVILQPTLARLVAQREHAPEHGGRTAIVLVWLTGIYGGYFGAAQGVLLMAFLGILIDEHAAAPQRGQERARRARQPRRRDRLRDRERRRVGRGGVHRGRLEHRGPLRRHLRAPAAAVGAAHVHRRGRDDRGRPAAAHLSVSRVARKASGVASSTLRRGSGTSSTPSASSARSGRSRTSPITS